MCWNCTDKLYLQPVLPAGSWKQAHMQARYAILRTLLVAAAADTSGGAPLVEIKEIKGDDGALQDMELHMSRDKILSVGLPAISDLLSKLNLYKAVADEAGGGGMFRQLTSVEGEWLEKRDVVLSKKQPRPVYVQAHTRLAKDGKVELLEFEPTHEGLIESFVTRY